MKCVTTNPLKNVTGLTCFWQRWTEPVDKLASACWLPRSVFWCLRHCWMATTTTVCSCCKLFAAAALLAKQHDTDISPAFPGQLLSFKLRFTVVHEVNHFRNCTAVTHRLLCSVVYIFTAYTLLLTLPMTVATCERWFSKLKLIKNYPYAVQCLLSDWAIWQLCQLKMNVLKTLDISKMVDISAQEKARKRAF